MANRKQNSRKPSKQPAKKTAKPQQKRSGFNSLSTLIVLLVLAAVTASLSLAKPEAGGVTASLQGVLKGLMGDMSLALPIVLTYLGIYQVIARHRGRVSVFHVFSVVLVALCVLTGAELLKCPVIHGRMQFYGYPNFVYNAYLAQTGGGVLGSLSWFLYKWLQVGRGMIVVVGAVLLDLVLLFRLDLENLWSWFTDSRTRHAERAQKRREQRELDEMFEYDDFEDRPLPKPRRSARAQAEEKPSAPPSRPTRRSARPQAGGSAVPPVRSAPLRTGAASRPESLNFDDEPATAELDMDTVNIPELRRRRKPAAPQADEPRTVRPFDEPQEKPEPDLIFEEDEPEDDFEPPVLRLNRNQKPRTRQPAPQDDPFRVQRTRLKNTDPIDGNDFAGGHIRDVHGQSMLHGQTIGGTIEPRMPSVKFDEELDEERDVPLAERDLTIIPDEYESPDNDDLPFDVEEKPVKKDLGTFTRRKPRTEDDEEGKIEYNYPPLDLLAEGDGGQRQHTEEADLDRAAQLEDTLHAFGANVTLSGIAHGPSVTRFEFKLPRGMHVKKITSLVDNIAYDLAALSVRIEAPIPGKTAVGIELPNEKREIVWLRDVLESKEACDHPSRVAVCLGKDNAGRYIVADIAKMPHLLVAGETNSGKSVCINSIITSILFRASPEEVKLIMIDPKVVELSVYNGIPHLIGPVVTDANKAAAALDWAVVEMEARYKKFAAVNARNLKGYHARLPEGEKPLPQIVVIIDELADLMATAPGEVETSIARLTAKARAAGIYLVIATQRPVVSVVTGNIKANIPARIAFKVGSNTDSRTIFDNTNGMGAEKLLGNGDMLFVSNGNKPIRAQGAWIDDSEVEDVVNYIRARHGVGYDEDFIEHMERRTTPDAERDEEVDAKRDDRLEEAIEIVLELGQASISMLQRKMGVGYARAGRLIDEMCRRGIVSEANGSKPRTVLITKEEFYSAFVDE